MSKIEIELENAMELMICRFELNNAVQRSTK